MLKALNNIHTITKLVEQSKDNQIVRATNTQLTTDKNVKTYFYVRKSKIDQLWQKLTDWTDGAKAKQALAKGLIIHNLKIIINSPEFNNIEKFPDAEERETARANIKKIITTLEGVDKDITASMIKNDLKSLKSFFQSYESAKNKFDNFNRSPESKQKEQDESLTNDQNSVAVSLQDPHSAEDKKMNQGPFNLNPLYKNPFNLNPLYESEIPISLYSGKSKELDPAKSSVSDVVVAESPTVVTASTTVEKNASESEMVFLVKYLGIETGTVDQKKALSEIAKAVLNETENGLDDKVFTHFWIEENEESKKNELLDAVKDALKQASQGMSNHVTSVDVAEVVLNSLDPTVDGKTAQETNSWLAESAPTINTTLSPIGDAIEQGMDAAEAGTERTPSLAPSAATSTAETKSAAKANLYLESLNAKWSAEENGYFEIIKPFYITSEMPTSKILAQAYLLPEGKKLEFFGKKDEASQLNKDQVVHGEHEIRDDLDLSNEKRDSRTYLKLEVKSDMKAFQGSPKMALNPAVVRMTEDYKNSLITIYKDSVEKISAEYKKTNPGKELETLVIVPITSTEGILLPVESTALVLAVKEIQLGNPSLKIAISADRETHSDDIQAAYAT